MKDMKLWSEDFYENYGSEEEAKKSFGDLIVENKGYESLDEVTYEDIMEEFYEETVRHHESTRDALLAHDKRVRPLDGGFLVLADLGLWNGRQKGGKIMGSLLSVLRECSKDSDNISWEIKDNNLLITAPHHDGTNYFTVYYITPKGYSWAFRNYGNAMHTSQQCHEHLKNTKGYIRKMFSGSWKFEW